MTDLSWILTRVGMMIAFFIILGFAYTLIDNYDRVIARDECFALSKRIANKITQTGMVPVEIIQEGEYKINIELPEKLHGQEYQIEIAQGLVSVYYLNGYKGEFYKCPTKLPNIVLSADGGFLKKEGEEFWRINFSEVKVPEKLTVKKLSNGNIIVSVE